MVIETSRWSWAHTAATLLLPVALVVAMIQVAASSRLLLAWWIALAGMTIFVLVCGHGITRRWLGALIDERNVMSLSRFQMAAWTVVVLSAFLTAVLWNVLDPNNHDPLNVAVSQELWILMGISTTSLVASPLILSGKAERVPDASEAATTFELLAQQGDDKAKVATKGQLVVNTDLSQARFSDMFTGEEAGNAAHLDLTRLQMFFFTLVTLASYAIAVGYCFQQLPHGPITQLPPLNSSMLVLIAISHAGYLAAKSVPHSQTGSSQLPHSNPQSSVDNHPAMG